MPRSSAAGLAVAATGAPTADSYELALLSQPSSQEVLPVWAEELSATHELDTMRFAGEDDVAQYWVSLDAEGLLCLTAYIGGSDWVTGTACGTPDRFAEAGIGLRLYGPSAAVEAYLVSDASGRPASLDAVGTNIYTFDPMASSEVRDEVMRGIGSDVSLSLFEEPLDLGDSR